MIGTRRDATRQVAEGIRTRIQACPLAGENLLEPACTAGAFGCAGVDAGRMLLVGDSDAGARGSRGFASIARGDSPATRYSPFAE